MMPVFLLGQLRVTEGKEDKTGAGVKGRAEW